MGNEKNLTETDMERLARLNRERIARDLAPYVPPEHIVSGECTLEALSAYLTQYPFVTIRAREAAQMYAWMAPMINAADKSNWGLLDIIGDNPGEAE